MRTTNPTIVLGAVLGLCLTAACEKKDSETSTSDPQTQTDTDQALRANCPAAAENIAVDVTDTTDGVAMTFTTDRDVDGVRLWVNHMAHMYEIGGGHRMMWHRWRDRGRQMGPGMMGMGYGLGPMPASKANVETIDRGARLVLTPEDPAQLGALRERARRHGQRMQSGQCWTVQPES